MDEERQRELLRHHVAWGVRPGGRVVFHDAIAATGADVEAVGRFVEEQGGSAVSLSDRSYWLLPDRL